MTIEQFLNGVVGSSWLLPLLALFGWGLVKYLSDKFTTTQTFDNYVKAVDERMDEFETKKREVDRDLYEKNRELGLEVAEIKGKLDK